MNETSSRSHCIASVFLTKKVTVEGKLHMQKSMLQFVDLAGSERTDKTGLEGQQEIRREMHGIESMAINWEL